MQRAPRRTRGVQAPRCIGGTLGVPPLLQGAPRNTQHRGTSGDSEHQVTPGDTRGTLRAAEPSGDSKLQGVECQGVWGRGQ